MSEILKLPVIDPGPGLPRTLDEALAVIHAMHDAVTYLRHPEVGERRSSMRWCAPRWSIRHR